MRNGLKFIGLAAIAALSLTALAVQEGVVLKRSPKVGDLAKYRLKAEMDIQGQAAAVSALVTDKVTKVAENGDFTVESSTSETKVTIGGSDIDAPDHTETTVFSGANEVISVTAEQEDPNLIRTANMQSLKFPDKPLKVGDSWTTEFKKNDKGAVDSKGSYSVEARETIDGYDTFRIKGSNKESVDQDPMSAEGTFWINVKDGSLVKVRGALKNWPIPGVGPTDMKMTLTREK